MITRFCHDYDLNIYYNELFTHSTLHCPLLRHFNYLFSSIQKYITFETETLKQKCENLITFFFPLLFYSALLLSLFVIIFLVALSIIQLHSQVRINFFPHMNMLPRKIHQLISLILIRTHINSRNSIWYFLRVKCLPPNHINRKFEVGLCSVRTGYSFSFSSYIWKRFKQFIIFIVNFLNCL